MYAQDCEIDICRGTFTVQASASEWNGRRGLVHGFDSEKGKLTVSVEGREKPLGLKLSCCVLEMVGKQALQGGGDGGGVPEPQATKCYRLAINRLQVGGVYEECMRSEN